MSTFGVVHRFPGGTREQYENVRKVVHPDGGQALPEGQMLHLAGESQDGWLVMAVHDSRESWERFRDETLFPALASIDNGMPTAPEEMTFDVQVFQTRERKA